MSRKKIFVLCVMIFLCIVFLLRLVQSSHQASISNGNRCPDDVIIGTRECFSDFSNAVMKSKGRGRDLMSPVGTDNGSIILLDYSQIKISCGTNGHMSRFVRCIDEKMATGCDLGQTQSGVDVEFNQNRVKQMVPLLCQYQNDLHSSSRCMADALNKTKWCQEKVYTKVKEFLSQTTRNAKDMLTTQCRFSYSMAECQRSTISKHCGPVLGDLHADFLLSFVPEACSDSMKTLQQAEDEAWIENATVNIQRYQ